MNKLIFKLLVLITLFIAPPYLYANEKPTLSELNIGWYFPSINAMVSRTDFHVAINLWLDEFNDTLNIGKTNVVLFDHIKNMQKAFKHGNLSIIVAPPLLIVENFNLNKLADGFTGTSVTGKPYGIVVLARKNSGIKSLKDVKNKRLVLPDKDELAQVFLNSILIPEYHQPYQQVFKSTRYFLKQHSIIHQLFFNKADVGVAYLETFNLMVELNPQIEKKIMIIDNFAIDSPNYSFFYYQVPENIQKLFIDKALKLNDSIKSQEILHNFRMATIKICKVDSLKPFIDLHKLDTQLKQQLK